MLFSIVFAGVGICKGIMGGRMLGEILPFYIVSFLGMYLYFSLSAMVDIKGKRRILKTNLIDYLENHLSGRIPVTEQDYERLYGPGSLVEEIATSGKAGRRQRASGRRTVELMPISSRMAQPEETGDRLDREVFSVENAAHEKPGEKVLPQRPEDPRFFWLRHSAADRHQFHRPPAGSTLPSSRLSAGCDLLHQTSRAVESLIILLRNGDPARQMIFQIINEVRL
jgi:hypothetical protein